MDETWKDIDGYEGLYKISNFGRVLSLRYGPKNRPSYIGEPKMMKLSRSSSGYYHVQLYKDGKPTTKLVHSLVASAFVDNPFGKPEVNHIDGDKSNNKSTNLEWVTKSENLKHADRIGLRVSPMKGITGALNHQSKPVLQYDLQGNFIKKWDCRAEAARFYNIAKERIGHCVNGKTKTCIGFVWIDYVGDDIKLKIEPIKRKTR